jgi:hypothetical protein
VPETRKSNAMKIKQNFVRYPTIYRAIATLEVCLLSALLLFSGSAHAAPMGTTFTYQGNLTSGTNAVTGLYDFSFALFDAVSGGIQKGPTLSTNAVPVTNGYFIVTLDFGSVWPGDARWLAIFVKTNGAGSYTLLAPRQALTPTPYAITANASSNLLGALPAGSVGNVALAASAVTSDKIADGTIANADLGAGIDASKIIGGDLQAYRLKVGANHTLSGAWATIAGGDGHTASGNRATVSGGDLNEAINNHTTVGGGNRNKAYGDAATVAGGNVNTASGNASTVSGGDGNSAGGQNATIGGGSANASPATSATVAGGHANTAGGNASTVSGGDGNSAGGENATVGGGNGNASPATSATVAGGYANTASGQDSTVAGGSFNYATNNYTTVGGGSGNTSGGVSATVAGGNHNMAQGQDSTVGGGFMNNAGGQRATVPGGWNNRATGDYSFAAGQSAVASAAGSMVFSDSSGNDFVSSVANEFAIRAYNGVRIQSDVGLHLNAVNRPLIVRDWDLFSGSAPSGKANIGRWGLFMEPYALVIGIPNTDVGARYMEVARYNTDGTRDKIFGVGNNGITTIKVLSITGGSDLAEPFAISDPAHTPKGTVMVIDHQRPGQLRVSSQPYDKRVAGVISGAGGLNPGVTIAQEGLTDKGAPVALSGRVYTLADTCNGPIQAGDLLTTSATRGHAMKVTDYAQAQGAIIGKAMGNLTEGKGLVLVLVTLQ